MAPKMTSWTFLQNRNRTAIVAVQVIQLAAAITIVAIVSRFVAQLSKNAYGLPTAFYVLLGFSALMILGSASIIFLTVARQTSSNHRVFFQTGLLILWIISFSLTVSRTHIILSKSCSISSWANKKGAELCSLYKTLFGAAFAGIIGAVAAFIMEIVQQRDRLPKIRYMKAETVPAREMTTAYKDNENERRLSTASDQPMFRTGRGIHMVPNDDEAGRRSRSASRGRHSRSVSRESLLFDRDAAVRKEDVGP